MTTGWDLGIYTIRFMARPWHKTNFYTYYVFLHFAGNSQLPDEGKEYDWLWNLKTVFEKLNKAYTKFYNLLEHLAVDEVIVNSRAELSSGSTFQRKESISTSKFTNSVINQGTHMTWECTSVETHTPPLTTWL